jgi:acyl transferase domain-containing protein
MGLRLPGGITTPADLEHVLERSGSVVGPVPEQRWKRMCEDLHPDEVPDQPWTLGVVDDLTDVDHAFFSISVDEAAQMDPQQKKLLEVVYEAVQDAGIRPSSLAGPRTGVYTGAASFDQAARAFAPGTTSSVHAASGASMAVLANRISYHLDAQGPSLNFDSACSASGTALHYALRDLRSGVVDTAIVAGTNSLEAAPITAGFHKLGVLAPDGVCAPFDTDAHGYVRSEGMVALVLRRAENVDPRVHRAYAHLAGSGLSHGGRAPHLVAPRAPHQARAITQALVDAQLTPAQVGVVHAHGTGTKAGDLEETRGLVQGYTDHQSDDSCLLVGSSKAALGHTEGAAALVGVCVMALGLHRRQVWPTVHHTQPLPLLGKKCMRVPTRIEPWPHTDGQPLAGGVSAFGFGGSNFHAVLEEYRPEKRAATPAEFREIPARRHMLQFTFQSPGEAVEWAGKLHDAGVMAAQPHPPMQAAVVISADIAGFRAHHDEGSARAVIDGQIARLGNLFFAAGELPHMRPHPRLFALGEFGADIFGAWDSRNRNIRFGIFQKCARRGDYVFPDHLLVAGHLPFTISRNNRSLAHGHPFPNRCYSIPMARAPAASRQRVTISTVRYSTLFSPISSRDGGGVKAGGSEPGRLDPRFATMIPSFRA